MESVLLIIHLMIAVALVGVVLLQRSEGGALGIGGGGGGGGGLGGMMSGRGAALTRTTAFLAAAFFATSIALSLIGGGSDGPSLVDQIENQSGGEAPLQLPNDGTGGGTALPAPSGPAVPLSQ